MVPWDLLYVFLSQYELYSYSRGCVERILRGSELDDS